MPTTPSGLQFFPDQFTTGRWEGLAQFITGFNAASANAIRLSPGNVRGRRRNTTFFNTNASFVQRRDPEATGDTTWQTLGNATHTSIKVYRNSRYLYRKTEYADLGLSEMDGQILWGQQFGALQAQDMLNTALAALTGAVEAIGASAIHDITGATTKTMSYDAINLGMAKMGDAGMNVAAICMHSKPWYDLIGDALLNQKFAPAGANLIINEGVPRTMNRTSVVTDSPSFIDTVPDPDQYKALGLFADAVTVELNPEDEAMEFGVITGSAAATPENISAGLMVDYAFTINIRGVRYAEASVNNPDAATIADSSNWSLVASNRKLGPGFMIVTE